MKTFLFLLLFILSHSKVIAQDAAAVAALRAAFTASERGNWDIAERLVRPAGAVAIDLVEWDKLRAGEGQFVDTLDFLVRRPDWPGLPYLRKRSEITITKDDMKLNSYRPKMEVDPETYEVRADGELLICEPAEELSMAQRYFLF